MEPQEYWNVEPKRSILRYWTKRKDWNVEPQKRLIRGAKRWILHLGAEKKGLKWGVKKQIETQSLNKKDWNVKIKRRLKRRT